MCGEVNWPTWPQWVDWAVKQQQKKKINFTIRDVIGLITLDKAFCFPFFQTNDLRYLFENVPADNIFVFLKHINLFNKV